MLGTADEMAQVVLYKFMVWDWYLSSFADADFSERTSNSERKKRFRERTDSITEQELVRLNRVLNLEQILDFFWGWVYSEVFLLQKVTLDVGLRID